MVCNYSQHYDDTLVNIRAAIMYYNVYYTVVYSHGIYKMYGNIQQLRQMHNYTMKVWET